MNIVNEGGKNVYSIIFEIVMPGTWHLTLTILSSFRNIPSRKNVIRLGALKLFSKSRYSSWPFFFFSYTWDAPGNNTEKEIQIWRKRLLELLFISHPIRVCKGLGHVAQVTIDIFKKNNIFFFATYSIFFQSSTYNYSVFVRYHECLMNVILFNAILLR